MNPRTIGLGKNCSSTGGRWERREDIRIEDVECRELYRSPEEPSHLAWVGMWKAPDGSIGIRFPQITGNPGLEASYAPWYGRSDFRHYGVENWEQWCAAHGMAVGPADAIATTRVDYVTMRSTDGGDSWETVSVFKTDVTDWSIEETRGYNGRLALSPDGKLVGKGYATMICRDGRIVDTHDFGEFGKETGWEGISAGRSTPLLGLRESYDNGRSWTDLQWVMGNFADGTPVTQATEEHHMVELGDGRLLCMIRCDKLGHPLVAWLARQSDGMYVCEGVEVLGNVPNAGMPALVRTEDGTIWYWGERHFYSLDDGHTWQGTPDRLAFHSYYGKMTAVGNRLLCVTQRVIGDNPYPHKHDAFIEQIRFSHRRVDVVQQRDPGDALSLYRIDDHLPVDLHLRVDVRPDHAEGLAFRISADGSSYYAFMVVVPGGPEYDRWEAPAEEDAVKLSAYFPGCADEGTRKGREAGLIATPQGPMAVLARIDGGAVIPLRRVSLAGPYARLDTSSWIQLQVKISGNTIQAAVFDGRSPATYLGVNDASCREGSVGLLTDGGSQGSFRELAAWPEPQMIRDNWSLNAVGHDSAVMDARYGDTSKYSWEAQAECPR